MAKSLIIYPFSDINVTHSKSSTNSAGYTLINEINNNTSGYLLHTFSTKSSTLTSTFGKLSQSSNITLNKIIIYSILQVNFYLGGQASNCTINDFNIYGNIIINGNTYSSESSTNHITNNNGTNVQLQVNNATNINHIVSSLNNENIQLSITTSGYYTDESSSKNSPRGNTRIYNANVTISYDNVYDCTAEIITGVGISSASPTTQEVVEGDSCTFSCTLLSSDWKFYGWYENSGFSGNPVSTSQTYTINSVTKNTTLYPRAIPKYNIHIYGDSTKFSYTCSATGNKEFQDEQVTISITPSSNIYKFSGIYEADTSGNKTSNHISNDNPYTFTMPASDVYLYVEIGKEIRIYVDCNNCSLQGQTSPILSSVGKTETITLTYDSSAADWSGIYTDNKYINRVSSTQTYTFVVGNNDIYLYAKAIPKQQIYVKENGSWVGYSAVYVKENGVWVKKDDYAGIFDTLKNYKRINV